MQVNVIFRHRNLSEMILRVIDVFPFTTMKSVLFLLKNSRKMSDRERRERCYFRIEEDLSEQDNGLKLYRHHYNISRTSRKLDDTFRVHAISLQNYIKNFRFLHRHNRNKSVIIRCCIRKMESFLYSL